MIHTPQRSKPVGEGDAHVMAHLGRVRMKCGQADIGVEAVHRLHEIEGGAEYVIRGAGANEARVGNIRAGERREHPGLSPHGGAPVHIRMARRSSQHEMAVAATEAQEDVLRTAGQGRRIDDRTGFETAGIHPAGKPIEIDKLLPAVGAHPRALLQQSCEARHPGLCIMIERFEFGAILFHRAFTRP